MLAASGESEILECKAATNTRRETAATDCAMLNQRGGHVLFGVSLDGRLVGQQVGRQPRYREHAPSLARTARLRPAIRKHRS